MAQEQTKNQENQIREVAIIGRKVKFFAAIIMVARKMETLKKVFNNLCPTKEEKEKFIAIFSILYPDNKLVLKYLNEWTHEAYLTEEALKQVNDRRLKEKPVTTKQFNVKDNDPLVVSNETEQQEKDGFFKRLKKLFVSKKGKVEKVSKEEIASEKQTVRETNVPRINEKALMERYNQRVQARVQQKHLSQPTFLKNQSAMSR